MSHRMRYSVDWNGKTGKKWKKEVSSGTTVTLATVAQSEGQKLILCHNTIRPRRVGCRGRESKHRLDWTELLREPMSWLPELCALKNQLHFCFFH